MTPKVHTCQQIKDRQLALLTVQLSLAKLIKSFKRKQIIWKCCDMRECCLNCHYYWLSYKRIYCSTATVIAALFFAHNWHQKHVITTMYALWANWADPYRISLSLKSWFYNTVYCFEIIKKLLLLNGYDIWGFFYFLCRPSYFLHRINFHSHSAELIWFYRLMYDINSSWTQLKCNSQKLRYYHVLKLIHRHNFYFIWVLCNSRF